MSVFSSHLLLFLINSLIMKIKITSVMLMNQLGDKHIFEEYVAHGN